MAIPFYTKKLVVNYMTDLIYPDQYIRYFTFFHSSKYKSLNLDPQIHQVYLEYLFEPKYRIATLLEQMNDEIEHLASDSDETTLNLLFGLLEKDYKELEDAYKKENIIESIKKRNEEIAKYGDRITDKKGQTIGPVASIGLDGIDEYMSTLDEIFKPFKAVINTYLSLFKQGKIIPKDSVINARTILNKFMNEIRVDKQSHLEEKASYHSPKYLTFKFKKEIDSSKGLIADLMNSLKKYRFLDNNTSIATFKAIFSGEKTTDAVKWFGTQAELHYFIDKIFPLLENSSNTKWQVCSNCFVDKYDCRYAPRTIGQAKTHEIKKSVLKDLDTCCNHLL